MLKLIETEEHPAKWFFELAGITQREIASQLKTHQTRVHECLRGTSKFTSEEQEQLDLVIGGVLERLEVIKAFGENITQDQCSNEEILHKLRAILASSHRENALKDLLLAIQIEEPPGGDK
jgi:hypothetical protein